jgi:hypothetical protein
VLSAGQIRLILDLERELYLIMVPPMPMFSSLPIITIIVPVDFNERMSFLFEN